MGILRNYINNGVPVANRIKFESNNKPLVVKNVPLVADAKVPTYTTEASRRLTDLERISKLMIKPEGLKYLANNAALKQLEFQPKATKPAGKVLERVEQGLADTAKLIGSTLAQVPVNGTGIHFVQSFAGVKGTYLEQKGFTNDVPPHVLVKPGFAQTFLKSGSTNSDAIIKANGLVPISPSSLKESIPGSIEGPGGYKQVEKSTTSGAKLTPDTGTYMEGVPSTGNITHNTQFGGRSTSIAPDQSKFDKTKAVTTRVNLGDPGVSRKLTGVDESIRQDRINLLGPTATDVNGLDQARDLIKFRFEVITPGESNGAPKSKHLYFRAYLDNFSDGFSAKWSGFNYVGRGETFYTYGGMDRNINVGFKIAAQSAEEMRPLYQKINVLASAVAPTYENNFMRGTLAKLTVGDYVYRQPGFIEKVDFQWDQEYPWEIAMNRPENLARDIPHQELPMVLDVTVSFKPIHNFLPTSEYTLASKEDALKGLGTLTGPRYISNGKAPVDGTPSKNRYINDE